MGIYAIALIFLIIPLSLRTYSSLKKGRIPLPKFQHNLVQSRLSARRTLGAFSPILFWGFHVLYALYAVAIEAWLAMFAAIVYMVISPMLTAQIKAKQTHVLPEVARTVEPNS